MEAWFHEFFSSRHWFGWVALRDGLKEDRERVREKATVLKQRPENHKRKREESRDGPAQAKGRSICVSTGTDTMQRE